MKTVIKEFFPVMIAVAGVIFAIGIYFIGFRNTENGIYTDIGMDMPIENENDTSSVIGEIAAISDTFTVKYIGGSRTIGDIIDYSLMFQVLNADNAQVLVNGISSQENVSADSVMLWLSEIRDEAGNSVMSKMYTEEIDIIEEIPSAFVLDLDTGELYIHQSGIYEVFVKVFDSNGNEYPYEFFMPVEVR